LIRESDPAGKDAPISRLGLRQILGTNWFIVTISLLIGVKFLLAVLTPLGYDFVAYMSAILQNDNTLSWSPWILLARSVYSLWLWLPLDHGDFLSAIRYNPKLLLPSQYLLTALVKIPLILCDGATAYLVYVLGSRLGGTSLVGRRAVLWWLANPFTTFFIEMWGSADIVFLTLSLASVTLIIFKRKRLGALAILAGIFIKISAATIWFALTACVVRRDRSRKDLALDVVQLTLALALGILGYFYWVTHGRVPVRFDLIVASFSNPSSPLTQYFGENFVIVTRRYYLPFWLTVFMGFYVLAAQAWPREDRAVVSLALTGTLFLYGLTDLPPTAFLWVLPFMALWHASNSRKGYAILLSAGFSLFLLAFHNAELTTNGLSFLFIPRTIIPDGLALVAAFQSLFLPLYYFGSIILSVFIGSAFAYGLAVIWATFKNARA